MSNLILTATASFAGEREATAALVAQAIEETTTSVDHFLILARADHHYVQAVKVAEGEFLVEYREGGPAAHFQLASATPEETRQIFLAELAGERAWRSEFAFKQQDFAPSVANPTPDAPDPEFPRKWWQKLFGF